MRLLTSTTFALSILFMTGTAWSQDAGPDFSLGNLKKVFRVLDRNDDMRLSPDEIGRVFEERIEKADQNGDSFIDLNEMADQVRKTRPDASATWIASRFDKLDRDGNGFVDQDELSAGFSIVFSLADRNQDGYLSLPELRDHASDVASDT